MDTHAPVPLLSIYRGSLMENRGTPIRVRSILERLARDKRFALTVASWDERLPFDAAHVRLSNRKFDDMRTLYHTVKREHMHIAMGHTMATWYYLTFLKLSARVPIMLEMHGFIEEEAYLYGRIGFFRKVFDGVVYGCFYRLCDGITACSDTATNILAQYNAHVRTVYGGVDTSLFNPTVPGEGMVYRNVGDTVIGYAGNMRIWQGIDFLLSAFKQVHACDASFRLAVLSSEKDKIHGTENVQVVGGISHEHVPAFLAECDILVIPRPQNEVNRISFPSKLIEYMAMGKPVVASATSDCHRVITHGVDGFTYPPGDESALVNILLDLKDSHTRQQIGSAGYREVQRMYSWDRQTSLVTDTLLSIVSRGAE